MEVNVFVTWVILIALLYMALVIIPGWRLRRAITQVIEVFRGQGAACFKDVKSIDELGLRPRSMMENLFRTRDFKPYALQLLIKEEVVHVEPNEYLCLEEEKVPGFLQKYGLKEKPAVG